jgi:hypothetical protein
MSGHVQRAAVSRLRADLFTENPPPRANDKAAIVSRKDDGGSCSKALSLSLAPLYAWSTTKGRSRAVLELWREDSIPA